jgi:protein-S-isoprenylcysteine O-methyltransferase Ste14
VSNLLLIVLVTLYAAQLVLQLPFEERGLRRFRLRYSHYCRLFPRFIPRLRPLLQQ